MTASHPDGGQPAFINWLVEGMRSLFFQRPRWDRLHATPWRMAALVAINLLFACLVHRLFIDGAALFNWKAVTAGSVQTALFAWACWLAMPGARAEPGLRPASVLSLLFAQTVCMTAYSGALFSALLRSQVLQGAQEWVHWLVWLAPVGWISAAALTALLRERMRGQPLANIAAAAAVLLANALTYYNPPTFWTIPPQVAKVSAPAPASTSTPAPVQAEEAPADEEADQGIHLTQEVFEAQAPLLSAQLGKLAPQRPGVIDMYTITFAPFEGEEVFRRESRMVAEVMASRFDAAGRGLQLINHKETAAELPWATPLNLERAIAGLARVMDRDEDVLFIHLTSHGASDGELAADFWPLDVAPVLPASLKRWLDQAGIRHRVISISACYAGNWVAPLAGDDTLVMTASDADHTSYGCGSKSDLTFFGRAMYDEQIRSTTLSFEQAHAAARKIILQRENEAGKTDGYSNPQIRVGKRIGATLQRQREQLQAR